MGVLSTVWTVALLAFNPNQNVLGDTISALGFSVCFYYGFTGLACAVYFRKDLFKSARNFFLAGLIPVVGGIMMAYVGDQGVQVLQHRPSTTTPSRFSASRSRSSSGSAAWSSGSS